MFEQEIKLLLMKKWNDEEKAMLNKLLDNLAYYKKLIPKSLKNDIIAALQMCNLLKIELETYRDLCNCNCGKVIQEENKEEDNRE